jgi:hypothetical protein
MAFKLPCFKENRFFQLFHILLPSIGHSQVCSYLSLRLEIE